jgi:deoxyribodipyrimidine photolyase
VREYLPELDAVPDADVFNWFKPEVHEKWLNKGVKYYKPMLDHSVESKRAIQMYKAVV